MAQDTDGDTGGVEVDAISSPYLVMAVDFLSAYVHENKVAPGDVVSLFNNFHGALQEADKQYLRTRGQTSVGPAEAMDEPEAEEEAAAGPETPQRRKPGPKPKLRESDGPAPVGKNLAPRNQPFGGQPVLSYVKPDYVACMHCGKRLKSIKRHLLTEHGQTPQEYRAYFSAPTDMPMVAPNYAKRRAELAKASGLGRRPAADAA